MFGRSKPRRRSALVDVLNGFLSLLVIGLLIAAGIVVWGVQRFYADGPVAEETSFIVEPGSSLNLVAQRLASQGLIMDAVTFEIGGRALDRAGQLQAGEFALAPNSSMADILTELTEGNPIVYQVTVPEGFTSWQVVERVRQDPNLVGEIAALPAEGALLPDTYQYQRGTDRNAVIARMADAQEALLAEIWAGRDPDLPIETPEELVILASIVEKETALADERPQVASVFINRLRLGMRLQSDPTIIYGITNGQAPLGRGLTRSEIEEPTAYNTYQIDALPPGPIANPGEAALRAVANPAETDFLYFVADGTGGHAFATNYADHQANVAAWRRIEREQAEAAAAAEAAGEVELTPEAEEALDALEAEAAEAVDEQAPAE